MYIADFRYDKLKFVNSFIMRHLDNLDLASKKFLIYLHMIILDQNDKLKFYTFCNYLIDPKNFMDVVNISFVLFNLKITINSVEGVLNTVNIVNISNWIIKCRNELIIPINVKNTIGYKMILQWLKNENFNIE